MAKEITRGISKKVAISNADKGQDSLLTQTDEILWTKPDTFRKKKLPVPSIDKPEPPAPD